MIGPAGQVTKGMEYAAMMELLKEKKITGTLKLVFLKPKIAVTEPVSPYPLNRPLYPVLLHFHRDFDTRFAV